MAAAQFKFYNIKEARARITELETENETLKGQVSALESNPSQLATDAQTALKVKDDEIAKHRADVDRLSKENEAHAAKLKETAAKIEGIDAEIEKRASAKALEITAAQGQPALKIGASENPKKGDKPKFDPNLKGLALARAMHAAETEGNPDYK